MNKVATFLLCMLLSVAASFPAHAGFLVPKQTASPALVVADYLPRKATPLQRLQYFRSVLQTDTDPTTKDTPTGTKNPKTAWKGIASLSCSALGYMSFALLAVGSAFLIVPCVFFVAGIVFGAMGVPKKNKYNGLAIAGLIINIQGLLLAGFIGLLIWALQDPLPGLI